MTIRPFTRNDFVTIDQWRTLWGVPRLNLGFYPPDGLIAPGLAAGFLTLTNAKIALLENFISNPEAPIIERTRAIRQIADQLEAMARQRGYGFVLAATPKTGVKKVCQQRGYRSLGEASMFGKEL